MHNMKKLLIALAVGLIVTACKEEVSPEVAGNDYLSRARVQLAAGEYEAARQQIKDLREKVPLALNAREAGIILMDSINLAEAQEELHRADSSLRSLPETATSIGKDTARAKFDEACQKVKFYLRKLQHDRKNRAQH